MSEEIQAVRTARKSHHCDGERSGCPGVIQAGQRYLHCALPPYSDHANEGWRTAKLCGVCAAVCGRPLDIDHRRDAGDFTPTAA